MKAGDMIVPGRIPRNEIMKTHDNQSVTIAGGLTREVWELGQLVLEGRFAQALQEGKTGYPVYRWTRFAARLELEALFDDLALNLGWRAQRLGYYAMLLDADGLFISAEGTRKRDY